MRTETTGLRIEYITLAGARLGEENPLPFFGNSQTDWPLYPHDSLPVEKHAYIGWQAGFRVLPYRMQDEYTRQREPMTYTAIILENENLAATFLPELGGRLVSLVYKPEQKELLARNPVFQPANLAIRNAWFSGGIEWNIGQVGHSFTTCSPVFAASIQGLNGEPGLRLYEFERCKCLFWQIDFYLPPGSPFLIAFTRVINPNPRDTSMYWWTNIAVKETPEARVLAPAQKAIYFDWQAQRHTCSCFNLPNQPTLDGKDCTYPINSSFANEFFFQCDEANMPWEVALDSQGKGLVEASTPRLKYRKLFCWGQHQGGRHWQEFLSPGGEPYLEIQAGLAPTQMHGIPMPAKTEWNWAQIFGYLEVDPEQAHHRNWTTAWLAVEQTLKSRVSVEELYAIEKGCRDRANQAPEKIIRMGSGWGALELKRRKKNKISLPIPSSFDFPETTIGPEQRKWLGLLNRGHLKEQAAKVIPGEWMIQDEWLEVLQKKLQKVELRNWYALLHLGVMLMEHFDMSGAEEAWQASIELMPSAWAYRNLAVLYLRQNKIEEALDFSKAGWELAIRDSHPPLALAIEHLRILYTCKQYAVVMVIYQNLPNDIQDNDHIQLLRGQAALELNDLETVEKTLERDFAIVREGETTLTDLWFNMWVHRIALQTGRVIDECLRKEIEQAYPPPARIDFRSVNS